VTSIRHLKKNCIRDGIRDPLVVWDGILIDGHNRYKIATEHGLSYKTEEIQFTDRREAKVWIIMNQLGRRNLPPATRILLAKKLEPQINEAAKERMLAGKQTLSPNGARVSETASQKIAKIAGVGHGTVDRFDYVQKHGTPQTVKKMESGEITIGDAYHRTRPTPVQQAKHEHEEFQQQKASAPVVDFSEVKKDRDNTETINRDLYVQVLKCGNAIDGICISNKSEDIIKMAKSVGSDKCKHLITMLSNWNKEILKLQNLIMEGVNE
jgi:hypothetical protein